VNTSVEECAAQVLALVPYVARHSPVRQRNRRGAMGFLATSYGVTAAEAGLGSAAVAAVGVQAEGSAPLVVGSAVGVGSVAGGARFAICRLSAIGICVLRRSWSESLKVCCGECVTWRLV
jgi:hypothetical protein